MKKVYILSILMALITGVSVYLFATSLEAKSQLQQIPTKKIVVAAADIPAKTQITPGMVALQDLPEQAANPRAATDLSKVIGLVTLHPLVSGEQVLSERLGDKGADSGTLAYALEEGRRAISIPVDDVVGVSGYVTKGDYVDIVATLLVPDGDQTKTVSRMLIENLLVLECGAKPLAGAEDAAPQYATVTLSVTPEEALMISYASASGKIRLLLRGVLDHQLAKPRDYPPS